MSELHIPQSNLIPPRPKGNTITRLIEKADPRHINFNFLRKQEKNTGSLPKENTLPPAPREVYSSEDNAAKLEALKQQLLQVEKIPTGGKGKGFENAKKQGQVPEEIKTPREMRQHRENLRSTITSMEQLANTPSTTEELEEMMQNQPSTSDLQETPRDGIVMPNSQDLENRDVASDLKPLDKIKATQKLTQELPPQDISDITIQKISDVTTPNATQKLTAQLEDLSLDNDLDKTQIRSPLPKEPRAKTQNLISKTTTQLPYQELEPLDLHKTQKLTEQLPSLEEPIIQETAAAQEFPDFSNRHNERELEKRLNIAPEHPYITAKREQIREEERQKNAQQHAEAVVPQTLRSQPEERNEQTYQPNEHFENTMKSIRNSRKQKQPVSGVSQLTLAEEFGQVENPHQTESLVNIDNLVNHVAITPPENILETPQMNTIEQQLQASIPTADALRSIFNTENPQQELQYILPMIQTAVAVGQEGKYAYAELLQQTTLEPELRKALEDKYILPQLFELAAQEYIKLGEPDTALTYIYRHIESAKQIGQISKDIYREKGIAELQLGRVRTAIKSFKEGLRIDFRNETCRSGLAKAYQLNGQHENALHEYEVALQINPKNVNTRVDRALLLEEFQPARAISEYENALAVTDDPVVINRILNLEMRVLVKQGGQNNLEKAAQLYEQVSQGIEDVHIFVVPDEVTLSDITQERWDEEVHFVNIPPSKLQQTVTSFKESIAQTVQAIDFAEGFAEFKGGFNIVDHYGLDKKARVVGKFFANLLHVKKGASQQKNPKRKKQAQLEPITLSASGELSTPPEIYQSTPLPDQFAHVPPPVPLQEQVSAWDTNVRAGYYGNNNSEEVNSTNSTSDSFKAVNFPVFQQYMQADAPVQSAEESRMDNVFSSASLLQKKEVPPIEPQEMKRAIDLLTEATAKKIPFSDIIAKYPSLPEGWIGAAVEAKQQGDLEQARRYYAEAIHVNPSNVWTRRQVADTLMHFGEEFKNGDYYADALAVIDTIPTDVKYNSDERDALGLLRADIFSQQAAFLQKEGNIQASMLAYENAVQQLDQFLAEAKPQEKPLHENNVPVQIALAKNLWKLAKLQENLGVTEEAQRTKADALDVYRKAQIDFVSSRDDYMNKENMRRIEQETNINFFTPEIIIPVNANTAYIDFGYYESEAKKIASLEATKVQLIKVAEYEKAHPIPIVENPKILTTEEAQDEEKKRLYTIAAEKYKQYLRSIEQLHIAASETTMHFYNEQYNQSYQREQKNLRTIVEAKREKYSKDYPNSVYAKMSKNEFYRKTKDAYQQVYKQAYQQQLVREQAEEKESLTMYNDQLDKLVEINQETGELIFSPNGKSRLEVSLEIACSENQFTYGLPKGIARVDLSDIPTQINTQQLSQVNNTFSQIAA